MEQIKSEQLYKLLTTKSKINIALNNEIYSLLCPTIIHAISIMLDTSISDFKNFDVYHKDEILVLYMENEINGELHSIKIGVPITMAFEDPHTIVEFMKQQINQYEAQQVEEYKEHAFVPPTHDFDLSLMDDKTIQQLKYLPVNKTRQ